MGTTSGWTDGVYRQDDGSPIYQNAPIDVTAFARFDEVKNYAIAEGIPIGQAVERLVNGGLSHLRPVMSGIARCRTEGHDWKPKPGEDNVDVCPVCSSERVDTGARRVYRYPAGYSPIGTPSGIAPLRIDDELTGR